MRHHRAALFCVTGSFLLGLAGCAADSMKPSSETPATSSVAQAQEGTDQLSSGEVQERAVPRRGVIPGVQGAPGPTGPLQNAPPPTYIGPTQNITAVANAIAGYHKSLTILVTVRPGLALTQPVTISIAFISPAGGNRLTQSYVAGTGNRFLYNDFAGDDNPRRMHLDITLTEPNPGGGFYSYNVPVDMDLDPLYDVTISPLSFTLFTDCSLVGGSDIGFAWTSPDGVVHGVEFHTNPGDHSTINGFAWARTEVSGSANLYLPYALNFTSHTLACSIPGFPCYFHGIDPLKLNLVPGVTRQVVSNVPDSYAQCHGSAQYNITYQLRSYPYLDASMVRDHR